MATVPMTVAFDEPNDVDDEQGDEDQRDRQQGLDEAAR